MAASYSPNYSVHLGQHYHLIGTGFGPLHGLSPAPVTDPTYYGYPSYNSNTPPQPSVIQEQQQFWIESTLQHLLVQHRHQVVFHPLWPDITADHQTSTTTTGLSKEDISKHLKTRKSDHVEDGNKICVVCQDGLCHDDDQEDEMIGMLGCGHDYHSLCIEKWLQRKNVCPLCNRVGLDL